MTERTNKTDDFMDWLDSMNDLDDDIASVPAEAVDSRPKFDCEKCAGTGYYKGVRIHQEKEQCFACRGRGYFFKSADDRKTAREKARAKKADRQANNVLGFMEKHEQLFSFLGQARQWNGFAASMLEAIRKNGELTERQEHACYSMMAKAIQREEERAKAKAEQENAPPTLARLAQAFLTAAAGLKFPKLRLQTEGGLKVVLSRAGANAKFPGSINITDGKGFGEGTWFGRILADGRAMYREAPADLVATLEKFNCDPASEIKVQGIRTGRCCVCSRELTDPASIAAGIGPVCAEKWGF